MGKPTINRTPWPSHRWHAITCDGHTKAMDVPGGVLVCTRLEGDNSVAMQFVPGVRVAHRWTFEHVDEDVDDETGESEAAHDSWRAETAIMSSLTAWLPIDIPLVHPVKWS